MADALATVAVYALVPIGAVAFLFLHEFGHVLPPLLAGGDATIYVGSREGRTATLGPLTLTVGVEGIWSVFHFGEVEWDGVDARTVHAAGIVGGPLVSAVVATALGALLLRGVTEPAFWVVAWLCLNELLRLVRTVVPMTYSRGQYAGMPSDGKRLLQLLESGNES